MKLKFLGTGTSQGVPVIGCSCPVCTSSNPKDRRYRSSVIITTDSDKKILIDCGPDFRNQMLENNEKNADAILLTHEHNDHVIGLDDVRPLIFRSGMAMPIYSHQRVLDEVKNRFPYAFGSEKYPGAPSFSLHEIKGNFTLFDALVEPVEVIHYQIPIYGFKFRKVAYITDGSEIPEKEKEKLKNLDVLVLNCIRKEHPHPAHFILEDILKLNKELQPKTLYLTHISHQFGTFDVEEPLLPPNIHLSYDGLEIDI